MIILVKEGSKSTTRKGARIWGDKVRRRVDDNKMLLMNRVADGLPPSRLVVCGTKDLVVDFFASSMCALLSKALTVFSPFAHQGLDLHVRSKHQLSSINGPSEMQNHQW